MNPVLTWPAAAEELADKSCARRTDFASKVPADAPEAVKAEVASGALTFSVVMGSVKGVKVLKWNGPSVPRGRGTPPIRPTEAR